MLYGSSGGQPIQVVIHVSDDWVEASVLDHGPQPPPGLPADSDTDELGAGGRGLWLLRRLVDEVRLERVELGTRVTLRRAIGPPASRSPTASEARSRPGRRPTASTSSRP